MNQEEIEQGIRDAQVFKERQERSTNTEFRLNEGMKFDKEKPDYTLIPWESLEGVVKVLEFGAKKYERDNWRKIGADRYRAAAARHFVSYMQDQHSLDEESGYPHLDHLLCCLLFIKAL